ncbi:sensor histidine kinase [Pseudoxanthomonas dokdonensis]|nr:sensor histidine kinase [Pseudoxanthomonas dokdonensis]
MEQGAPADIWALAQGRDGYLWLGTGSGLYRFDGIRFEAFVPPAQAAFASNNITSLYAASDGALWIGFLMGGISVLRDGHLRHYPAGPGVPADLLLAFAEDRDGTLWAAARDGFSRFDGQAWHAVGADWGYPAKRAHALLLDSRGTLWVATGETLVYLPRGDRRFIDSGQAVGPLAVLAETGDGRLWVSDGLHGTRALPAGAGSSRRQPQATRGFPWLANMRIDRAGTLWGTERSEGGLVRVTGLSRFNDGRSLQRGDLEAILRKRDGLLSDRAIPVLRDREDNIWIGTNLGLHRFRYNNVRVVRDARLTQHATYGIASSARLGPLVSSGRRLYQLRDGHPQLLAEADAGTISALVANADGSVWAKTETGLARLHAGRLQTVRLGDGDVDNAALGVISADGGGGVLVMRDGEGLFQIDDQRVRRIGSGIIDSEHATALVRQADGTLWIGYTGSRLARWDGRSQKLYTRADGLQLGTIVALMPTPSGLLVAGETGMAILRDGRIQRLHARDPQVLQGVTGIVRSDNGDLWLNGMRGVVRIQAADLASAIAAPARAMPVRLFDFGDGLPGVAQQYAPTATALADTDGVLWFATSQGLASIDPRQLSENTVVPPVHIRALTAGGQRHRPRPGMRLPAGTRALRLDYTALSLSVPEHVRFRYQLLGVDAGWQDGGGQRHATYTNLAPGEYRFRVIAANDSGLWNNQGDTLAFSIAPLFTQTWWFAALCVLAMGGLLLLVYLLRLRQMGERLRMRLEERHSERERIARELHDTLLQSVQGLVLRFQAVANRLDYGDPVRDALEQALDRADDVISEGRERVLDLRADIPAVAVDLAGAFVELGAQLDDGHGPAIRVVVEGRLPPMEPSVRDEIYWIGHEILSNAYRHAQASRIEVEIACSRRQLSLRFRDNGRGLADDVLRQGHKPGHWGLTGIRERARLIPARLAIRSAPGRGTEIELLVPTNALSLRARPERWRQRMQQWWKR